MISFTRKPTEYEIVNMKLQYYNDIATWDSGKLYYESGLSKDNKECAKELHVFLCKMSEGRKRRERERERDCMCVCVYEKERGKSQTMLQVSQHCCHHQ